MKKIMLIFLLTSFIAYGQSGRNAFLLGMFDNSGVSYTTDDVRYYNAKGDGVTDAFSSITTAIAANVGGTITLGASGDTYLISQPIYIPSNTTLNIPTGVTLRIQSADTSYLKADMAAGDSSFVVHSPSKFSVGQWVGVTDTNYLKIPNMGYYWGWVDKIVAIVGDTIKFGHHSSTAVGDTAIFNNKVSKLAKAGHCQSVIIMDSVRNAAVIGGGTIDGNGFTSTSWSATDNKIKIHPVTYEATIKENWLAGLGVAIRGSRYNIRVQGADDNHRLTIRESQMHNIAVTGANFDNYNSQGITIKWANLSYPRMKNILSRETDSIYISHCLLDSAWKEDGVMFYANVSRAELDTVTITNNGRNGISWNLSCGTDTNGLKGDSLKINGNATGVNILSKNVRLTNVSSNDNVVISNRFNTADDIRLTDYAITGNTADSYSVGIFGAADTVHFTNLTLNGCGGSGKVGIHFDTTMANSSYGSNGGAITNSSFTNGGIYTQTGSEVDSVNNAPTGVDWRNFAVTPIAPTVTAVATGLNKRVGTMTLTWTDTRNTVMNYIYKSAGSGVSPTTLVDSVAAGIGTKVYTTDTTNIWNYAIKSGDNLYRKSAYSATASDTIFEFEAARYFLASADTLSNLSKYNINEFVRRRKTNLGIDSLKQVYDVIQIYAIGDSTKSLYNLVDPTVCKGVIMDTMTFTPFQGWHGDVTGGNNYINTGYNPSVAGSNFIRNSAGLGLYVRTESGSNTFDAGQLSGGYGTRICVRYSTDSWMSKINDGNNRTVVNVPSIGYSVADRDSADSYEVYKNGSILANMPETSSTDPINLNIFVGAYNQNGAAAGFTLREYSFFIGRKSITLLQNIDEYTDIEWYMDRNGKGVIP